MAVVTLPDTVIDDKVIMNQVFNANNGDIIDGKNALVIQDSCAGFNGVRNFTAQVRGWNNGTIRNLRGYGQVIHLTHDRTRCYRGQVGAGNSNGCFLFLTDGVSNCLIHDTFFGRSPDHCGWDGTKGDAQDTHVRDSCWLFLYDDVDDNHTTKRHSWERCLFHSMMAWATETGSAVQEAQDCIWLQFQIFNSNKAGGHPIRGGSTKIQGQSPFLCHNVALIIFDTHHRVWGGGGWGNFRNRAQGSGDCLILDLSHLDQYGSRDGFNDGLPSGFQLLQGQEAESEARSLIEAFVSDHAYWDDIWPTFDWRDVVEQACAAQGLIVDAQSPGTGPPPDPSPVTINDTGHDILVGGNVLDINVLDNDFNVAGGNLTIAGGLTGPVTVQVVNNQILRVTSHATATGAWSVRYRLTTGEGFDEATVSGSVLAEPIPEPEPHEVIPHDPSFELDEGAIRCEFILRAFAPRQALFSKDSTGWSTPNGVSCYIDNNILIVRREQGSSAEFILSTEVALSEVDDDGLFVVYEFIFAWGPAGCTLYLTPSNAEGDDRIIVDSDTDPWTIVGNDEDFTIRILARGSQPGTNAPLNSSTLFQGEVENFEVLTRQELNDLLDIDEPDPDPDPNLEPVNPAIAQTAVTIGPANGPRMFHSFGWSLPSGDDTWVNLTSQEKATLLPLLTTDINAKMVRLWGPPFNMANALANQAPLVPDWQSAGIDVFLAAPARDSGPLQTPQEIADALDEGITGGIPYTHTGYQNEPGSSGRPDVANFTDWAPLYASLRSALDTDGHTGIELIAPEYASHDSRPDAFFDANQNDAAFMALLDGGAGHSYNMALRPSYRSRWANVSKNTWQTEAGHGSSNEDPLDDWTSLGSAAARAINDLNMGCSHWVWFIGLGDLPFSDSKQKLVTYLGSNTFQRNPTWYAMRDIFTKATRGTRFRRCVSDLPDPNMVYTFGVKPPLNVAAGRRTDGTWCMFAMNYTYDPPDNSDFGHEGAQPRQVTVTIPELADIDFLTWTVERTNEAAQGATVEMTMVNGVMRFTLQPLDLLTMFTGDAPDPPDPVNQVPTAVTVSLGSVSTVEAIINWTPATDPDGTVQHYEVRRNGVLLDTVNHPTLTFTDATVQEGQQYTYTVRAVDNDGGRAPSSNQLTVNVPGLGNLAPTASTLAVNGVTIASIALVWSHADDPQASEPELQGISHYILRRNGVIHDQVDFPTNLYSDNTVQPSTTYVYTVQAVDLEGLSGPQSNQVVVTTPAPPDDPDIDPEPEPEPGPGPIVISNSVLAYAQVHGLRELTDSPEDLALGSYLGVQAPGGFVIDRQDGQGIIGFDPRSVLQERRPKFAKGSISRLVRNVNGLDGRGWFGSTPDEREFLGIIHQKVMVLRSIRKMIEGQPGSRRLSTIIRLYDIATNYGSEASIHSIKKANGTTSNQTTPRQREVQNLVISVANDMVNGFQQTPLQEGEVNARLLEQGLTLEKDRIRIIGDPSVPEVVASGLGI